MVTKKTSTKSAAKAAGASLDADVPEQTIVVSVPDPVETVADVKAVDALDANVAAAGDAPGAGEPGEAVVTVKLKGLVDQVTELSGVNKKDARNVVEVVLQQLGDALRRGETLSLPGLGRIRVLQVASAENPVARLRMRAFEITKPKPAGKSDGSAEGEGTQALADKSEDV